MSKFKVGDLVIGQNFIHSVCRNGLEGEIIKVGPIDSYNETDGSDMVGDYLVKWADGDRSSCKEHCLRKRPDDQPFTEWFRNTIITDLTDAPLETTMRNVARNLQKFTTDQEASRGYMNWRAGSKLEQSTGGS